MSIGGRDIVIAAPPDVSPAEVVLGYMRRLWPDGFFQDADQEDVHPINSPRVVIQGGLSREFFAFRDSGAVAAWQLDGATPENENSMLHFLVADPPLSKRLPRHVTLVCDELSAAIDQLIADLKMSFRGSRRPASRLAA